MRLHRLWLPTAICVALLSTAFAASTGTQLEYDLVIVQVPAGDDSVASQLSNEPILAERYVDGARIVRLSASGAAPVVLTPEFVSARDPDVSFDAETVVFAGKRESGDLWQIWRMSADGSNKEQITRGRGDKIAPVHAGSRFYLNDSQPTPQIIYASSADGWRGEHSDRAAFALYGTDHAGRANYRLTYNLESDFAPAVLPSGRIVFASWQRFGDRYGPGGLLALMGINLDGTDLMPFYGNHDMPRVKEMAHFSVTDDRVYFIESDSFTRLGGGDIAYVSVRRPLNSYRKLSHDDDGLYHSPASLPNGELIASYRPNHPTSAFGIYRVNKASGARQTRVSEDPGWHSIDAQVLAPRESAKGRSNWLRPNATTGVFYCLNSYRSNLFEDEQIAPGSISYVRVIEGMPPAENREDHFPSRFGARRLLGVAPVENDGSFHVRVPAETPITFQLLDQDYVALRSQKAWTWVMGNENRGCIGCHEDRELSPPNSMVAAIIKPPVELTLPPNRRRTVDFRNQIAPILAEKCATGGCHVSGQVAPDLSRTAEAAGSHGLEETYRALLGPIPGRDGEQYLIAGSAKVSPLIALLLGRRLDAAATNYTGDLDQMPPHNLLNQRDRILFVEWVDLGAQWDSRATTSANTRQK